MSPELGVDGCFSGSGFLGSVLEMVAGLENVSWGHII